MGDGSMMLFFSYFSLFIMWTRAREKKVGKIVLSLFIRADEGTKTFLFFFFFNFSCLTCVALSIPREAEEGVELEGNARLEGYSMDLIDAISKILHFQYRFELVPDGERAFVVVRFHLHFSNFSLLCTGKYGSYNKVTKQWDGLVRHLLDRVSWEIGINLCSSGLERSSHKAL